MGTLKGIDAVAISKTHTHTHTHIYILELHSPLMNSSGSSTRAGEPSSS